MRDGLQTFRIRTLNTGFESPAYWIYDRFGSRGIGPSSGEMLWRDTGPVRRKDWRFFNPLAARPVATGEDLPCRAEARPQGPGQHRG